MHAGGGHAGAAPLRGPAPLLRHGCHARLRARAAAGRRPPQAQLPGARKPLLALARACLFWHLLTVQRTTCDCCRITSGACCDVPHAVSLPCWPATESRHQHGDAGCKAVTRNAAVCAGIWDVCRLAAESRRQHGDAGWSSANDEEEFCLVRRCGMSTRRRLPPWAAPLTSSWRPMRCTPATTWRVSQR